MRFLKFTLTFNNVALIQWSSSSDLAVSRLFNPFKRALSALVGWRLRGVHIVVGLVWGFRRWEFLHDVLQGSVHFDWCGGDGGVLLTTRLTRLSLIRKLQNIWLVLPLLFSDLVPLVPQASTIHIVILLLSCWLYLILKLWLALLSLILGWLLHCHCSIVN